MSVTVTLTQLNKGLSRLSDVTEDIEDPVPRQYAYPNVYKSAKGSINQEDQEGGLSTRRF